jgi:hypothetical protein
MQRSRHVALLLLLPAATALLLLLLLRSALRPYHADMPSS